MNAEHSEPVREGCDAMSATSQAEQTPDVREEGLRLLTDQVPAVLWSTDRNLVFISAVGAGLAHLGLRPNQIVGMSLYEYFGTDNPDFLPILMHHRALAGESASYEQEWGGRAYQCRLKPLRGPDGAILGITGIALDITERKQTQEDLQESEQRFRGLADAAFEGIVVHDRGEILEANRAFANLFGYEVRELIGTNVLELATPESRELIRQRMLSGSEELYEASGLRRDGTRFYAELRAKTIAYRGRAVRVAAVRDVTQRKWTEEQLYKQNEYLAALHDTALALMNRLEPADLLEAIVTRAAKLAGTPHGYIYLAETGADELVVRVGVGVFSKYVGERIGRGEGLSGKVWQTGKSISVSNYGTWQGGSPRFRGDVFRAVVGVPLNSGQEVVGVIGLAHLEEGREFDDEQISALGRFAELASLALDNARLYTSTLRELAERKRAEERTAAFSVLGQRLSAAATAVSAARIIAGIADDLLGWDAFALLLYSAEDDLLHPILNFDLLDGQRTEFALGDLTVPPGPVSRRAMLEGPQLLLPERPSAVLEGLQPFGDTSRPSASLMFVPVYGAGSVTGVLSIQSYTARAYNEVDLGTLQALADHCGGALERIRAEEALRESEERFRAIFERTGVGIALAGLDTRVVQANPALQEMLGYSQEELQGQSIADFTHPEDIEPNLELYAQLLAGELDRYEMEKRYIRKDGELFWGHLTVSMIPDAEGRPQYVIGLVEDITQRKAFQKQLAHQALHDPLTGLANRVLFMDRLEHALTHSARYHYSTAVLFVDLDRFKYVNDSFGHEAGDRVLVGLAERLRACLRPEDTPARLSGDEFAVLLECVTDVSEAARVAERIAARLGEPFTVEGREVVVSSSIGITLGTHDDEPASLLRQADVAMYRAKNSGKAHYQIYDGRMGSEALERLELEYDLRWAVERGELEMYYQPQVELATGSIVGMEALLRWKHPQRGVVPPAEFIAMAEETGLLLKIGRWSLEEACRQAKAWQEWYGSDRPFVISVNLSAKQFQEPGLVEMLARVLQKTGLDPHRLGLEITESVLMEDSESTGATLRGLKDLGVRLLIDDFGTGYSSLSYLKRLPVDGLKIDRSFVAGLGEEKDTAIVQAVITLAGAFRMQVIAEGVESAEHTCMLQELGCRLGQGYYYAEPLPSDAAEGLLAEGYMIGGEYIEPS